MEANQGVAQAIEAAWATEHLPTFKTFLKEDLALRQAAAARPAHFSEQVPHEAQSPKTP
jgi:hypothetical protein